MNASIMTISNAGLVAAFVPVAIVIAVQYRWSAGAGTAFYATVRMLGQLLAIGYVLIYLFNTDEPLVVGAVLAGMLGVASWIALRPLGQRNVRVYARAYVAISVGGLSTLALVTQVVLAAEPWFQPRFVIPLAGMTIAGAMNAVSLAADRFDAERGKNTRGSEARRIALQTAMIPVTNSLFAVGLVSLPGMMTGQILSGVSPLLAAKYQIVVMTMLFGSAGIAAALYLWLADRAWDETLLAEPP